MQEAAVWVICLDNPDIAQFQLTDMMLKISQKCYMILM